MKNGEQCSPFLFVSLVRIAARTACRYLSSSIFFTVRLPSAVTA